MYTDFNQKCIGTCSVCGGRVMQYIMLAIVGPWPPAKCENCGSQQSYGPVIPMVPAGTPRPDFFSKRPFEFDFSKVKSFVSTLNEVMFPYEKPKSTFTGPISG